MWPHSASFHTQLGHALLTTIFEAMQHGYNETERFAAIGALVLASHVDDGAAGWLIPMLDSPAATTHRMQRFLNEMIMTAMGLVRAVLPLTSSCR